MINFSSTRLQGDFGVASAIYYFTMNEYHVSIPLSDNQHYDLIVEKDKRLYTVQVKSTSSKNKYDKFVVQLRRVRCNNSTNNIHEFDNDSVDYIYVVTMEGNSYLIPSKDIIAKQGFPLTSVYDKYLVLKGNVAT